MAQLRVQRLRFEDLLSKQPQLRQIRRADGEPLTSEQNKILQAQLRAQNELLNSLLRGGDTLMLELTKLKVANGQLEDALKDQRSHPPLSVLDFGRQPHRLLMAAGDRPGSAAPDLLDTISELGKASAMMLTSKETLLPLFAALLLVGFSISSRRHFTRFLERSSARVGKVTQDHFWLTLRTVFWSILVASPLPVLWMTLGYGLQSAAVPAGGGDWRWSHRDGASAVGGDDLRHLRPAKRAVYRPLRLAA